LHSESIARCKHHIPENSLQNVCLSENLLFKFNATICALWVSRGSESAVLWTLDGTKTTWPFSPYWDPFCNEKIFIKGIVLEINCFSKLHSFLSVGCGSITFILLERACDSILSLDKLFAQVLQILLVSSTVAVSSDKDLHLSLYVSEAFHKMFV
jgi:hypothetical protein